MHLNTHLHLHILKNLTLVFIFVNQHMIAFLHVFHILQYWYCLNYVKILNSYVHMKAMNIVKGKGMNKEIHNALICCDQLTG